MLHVGVWFFVLFVSLALQGADATATCTVSSCTQFMRDLSDGFFCDSAVSCRATISSHLEQIVPVDSVEVYAAASSNMSWFLANRCLNLTVCANPADSQVVSDLFVRWARIPTSSSLAYAEKASALSRIEFLRNNTCASPTDEESAEKYDKRCASWLSFASFEKHVCEARVLHMLWRERDYLDLLQAVCTTTGRGACKEAIDEVAMSTRAKISDEVSSFILFDDVLVFRLLSPTRMMKTLNRRSCGRSLACVPELLNLILSLDKKASVDDFSNAIVEAHRQMFLPFGVNVSQAFQQGLDLFSAPLPECGFRRSTRLIGQQWSACRAVQQKLSALESEWQLSEPELWVTKVEVERCIVIAAGCWKDCQGNERSVGVLFKSF